MNFEINTIKNERHWLAEAPALDLMSQGATKKEALEMLQDATELLVNQPGFSVSISHKGKRTIITANKPELLIALFLRRQRQKHGLTLQELASRLGSNSPNSFARYEQGKTKPSLAKLTELLLAINPNAAPILKLL